MTLAMALLLATLLGSLAFFEPCTVAVHALYMERSSRSGSRGCWRASLTVWVVRILLVTLPLLLAIERCPPWRAKRRRVVPGSREATRDTRRAEGAKGDPKGASERGVQSYGRPVCSRNELAMLWRNAG